MKRIFIAIDINSDSSMTNMFAFFRQELKDERIRWVKPSNIHLTLAFLGDMDNQDIDRAKNIVSNTVDKFKYFTLQWDCPGVFRDLNRPRVIWLGLKENRELNKLREELCDQLRQAGLYSDKKAFSPHLTLGRMKFIKNRDKLAALLEEGSVPVPHSQRVTEIVLYESILTQDGPEYVSLAKYPLKHPAP